MHEDTKDMKDITNFLGDLPLNLRHEVSMFIHEDTYKKINFLRNQSAVFITWICPRLRPILKTSG